MAAGDLGVAPVREAAIVYRIVRGADRSAPAVLDSLRSHYERGAPPRGYERRLAVILQLLDSIADIVHVEA